MTSSPLHVIALISGGKDSLFSILHCIANGHKIVALANLYPEAGDGEDEDINSYMYQTVGHSVIPLYEEALGIPLYRQPIIGSAVDSSREYRGPTKGHDDDVDAAQQDETESLVPLLQRIKAAHPEADAISTGAILSTYQRTRVESVALRLGLTPLSYLWQSPSLPPYADEQLLHDMRAVGQVARVIKVASGGLDANFLWEDVADPKVVGRIARAVERFGTSGDGAVLGEGGEFETLAVDGPAPLWKKRVQFESHEVVQGEGGTAVVKLKGASLMSKELNVKSATEALRIPDLLDIEFETLLLNMFKDRQSIPLGKAHKSTEVPGRALDSTEDFWAYTEMGNTAYLSNMALSSDETPTSQMQDLVDRYRAMVVDDEDLKSATVVSSTLLLRSMSDFQAINPIYGSLFTHPNPPSRVTVACGDRMPNRCHVMLSLVYELGNRSTLSGLHVQSRSYWAPANIGPYSQAIAMDLPGSPQKSLEDVSANDEPQPPLVKHVHVAGQIPLVPATMGMAECSDVAISLEAELSTSLLAFGVRTVLALQHLWRVGRAMNVSWWTGAVAFLSSAGDADESYQHAQIAINAWQQIHERAAAVSDLDVDSEDEEFDVWDIRNRGLAGILQTKAPPQHRRLALPDYTSRQRDEKPFVVPPCFAVQVEELPRGSNIEWMSSGLTTADVDVTVSGSTDGVTTTDTKVIGANFAVAYARIETVQGTEVLEQPDHIPGLDLANAHCTLFATEQTPSDWLSTLGPTIIPCKRIWDKSGKTLLALVIIRYMPY